VFLCSSQTKAIYASYHHVLRIPADNTTNLLVIIILEFSHKADLVPVRFGLRFGRSRLQNRGDGEAKRLSQTEVAHVDFVPDAGQLSQVMAQATAPAFILGAVAGFISILLGRTTSVIDRIRSLNEIADGDTARAHLKSDIPRLLRRAKLLNSATRLALVSGMCTSLLLVVGFASSFLRVRHEYGAGILFAIAVALLGGSLFRFSQEVRIGLSEVDHYR
jgi:hypothetical protein